MKKQVLFTAIAMSILGVVQGFTPVQKEAEAQLLLNFLTATYEQTGVTYRGTIGSLTGSVLPLSFYSTPDYWGDYVGSLPGHQLQVTDVYNPQDYTLTPSLDSPGRNLQIERVNYYNGINIQDGAFWQMALAVCRRGGLKSQLGADLFDTATNQNQLLSLGFGGNAFQDQPGINRAVTYPDGTYSYNGGRITIAKNAYFFRWISRNWIAKDPFMDTRYMKYITAQNLPANPQYAAGNMTWMEWQPTSKENGWAFFIGPLQSVYLKQKEVKANFVSFWSTAVQNAVGTLFALRYMQSELGAIYDACKGSLVDVKNDFVNPYLASVDTSATAIASLMILQRILQDELQYETTLNVADKQQIHLALSAIRVMLFGGDTPRGQYTKGLLAFFKDNAWDRSSNVFYHQGDANNPRIGDDWWPVKDIKTVESNTWTVAMLGQPMIDSWYGFGSCYRLWQGIKTWGGFFGPDGLIWGVGYSDADNNGLLESYDTGVLSATTTASAINMLRCLITQYTVAMTSSKYSSLEQQEAKKYVGELQKDHDMIMAKFLTLRSDLYSKEKTYEKVRPARYTSLIDLKSDKLAFIDVSKRYKIPTGRFVNPLPGTAATAWALMLHYKFNPFKMGGDYLPTVFGAEL